MNKTELIEKIALDAEITKAEAQKALETFINVTTEALQEGEKVALTGFGAFSISERAARTGRNPQTGAPIQILAKNVVKFKAGKDLSSNVN